MRAQLACANGHYAGCDRVLSGGGLSAFLRTEPLVAASQLTKSMLAPPNYATGTPKRYKVLVGTIELLRNETEL